METNYIINDPLRKFTNRNFLIKYRFNGQTKWYLIGGGKLHTLVGEEKSKSYLNRAKESAEQIVEFRYQNTITIKFISR